MRFGLAFLAAVIFSGLLSSCSDSGGGSGQGTWQNDNSNKPVSTEDLHFFTVSREVFAVSCYQCHNRAQGMIRGGVGTDVYEEVKENAERIYKKVIVERRLPMNATALTQRQYNLLKAWLETGAPMQTQLEYSNYGIEE